MQKKLQFKEMWEQMQVDGYFREHDHYADWHPDQEDALAFDAAQVRLDAEPEKPFAHIDFTAMKIMLPQEYSDELGRAIKRNEYYWLPKLVELPQEGTVLDVGCGYGRSIEWLHKRFNRAIGIDISDYAVAIAKQRFAGIKNVAFYACDGSRLPLEIGDRTVDFIYCFTVFQHIPRQYTLSYLNDFHQVLRPGGKILFNLLSGINEDLHAGPEHTEWEIGYSYDQAKELVQAAGMELHKITEMITQDCVVAWLWVEAGLPSQ